MRNKSTDSTAPLPVREGIRIAWGGIERWASALTLFGLLTLLAIFLSQRPLWHTDLWGHLAYGRLIVERGGKIPQTEPLMPLSKGARFVDLAWLSQVLGYWAYRWQGIAALQFLYAATATACLGALAYAVNRRTRAVWPAFLALAVCLWIEWPWLKIIRPQLAGLFCYVILFGCLVSKDSLIPNTSAQSKIQNPKSKIPVPVLFAAWANLHGSFVVGLGLLVAFAMGRGLDLVRRTKKLSALYVDRRMRQFALLIPLAAVGALANPYGWKIFPAVWETSSNANLAELLDWQPLSIHSPQGQAAAGVAMAIAFVYWFTPRRISAVEVLLLIGLGLAAVITSRMIVWWGPVVGYYAAVHCAAIARRRPRQIERGSRPLSRATWAIASAGALTVTVVVSPLGAAVFRGERPEPLESLSADTPIDAAEFLRQHPPSGQVFNSLEIGDYLLWAGPPQMEIFVASHVHLVPADVWHDYDRVIDMQSGWESVLDRRRVNTVVLDALRHPELIDAIRQSAAWSTEYEDDRTVIFARKRPIERHAKAALR